MSSESSRFADAISYWAQDRTFKPLLTVFKWIG